MSGRRTGVIGHGSHLTTNRWGGPRSHLVGHRGHLESGAAVFDPRSLTDLAAWYEPDLDAGLRSQVAMVPDTATGGAFGTTLFGWSTGSDRADDTDLPAGVDPLNSASGNVEAGVRDVVATCTRDGTGSRTLMRLARTASSNADTVALFAKDASTELKIDELVVASTATAVPTTNDVFVTVALWGERCRVWIDGTLEIDYTLSTGELSITQATRIQRSVTQADSFSVRTVNPIVDFAEDSSAPGDVGLTDVDASITANSLYVSAVDGTGTDGIEATRSGSDIVITADSGTIATVTDPGSSGDDLRIVRKDVGVWVYSNADLATALTLSAPDAAAASGGYTDGTEAASPPLVTVLPDLSGQHQHAVQTDDGTDQGAGATTDRRPLLLSNITDGGTSALVGNDDATAYLVGPDLALSVPWSYASAIKATANNRADMASQGFRWYARRASGDFGFYGGASITAPSPAESGDQHVQYLTHGATGRIRLDGGETTGSTGTASWNQGFHLMARDTGLQAYEADDNLAAALFSDVDEASNIVAIEAHLARHTDWTP